ncbi:TIGR00725 family protein [Achromobacter sp. AONIH1]|uniref:TIGR00725 family protein n=1 Tax=Achromobacter sp. AONIH1 TaxID=1758194 RepID=UPI000CD126FC|nr:TIGR00725 family protein [Achromobacter sp. AONIH1]AUT49363.1 TIGR00725 family protein [Achromobacter sp. AONIH1]
MEKNRADTPLRIAPWASSMAQLAERQCGARRHLRPVGIIGPGDGDPRVCEAAYRVARALAQAGMSIVNGGRGGVMAAASRGARDGGGIAIGLLPEDDDRNANEWLSVAVATGMGEMRNALVARSAVCLAAIGGNMGTLSEMALGLKWGTPVFVMHGDVALPGAVQVRDVDEMLVRISAHLLA